ncbi:MAG TPA: gluconate 2-dehydrogenase subunit 3 family protein [Chitinophagaceae bacterium]|nr:gluconate 2-dehydrogenase subunit 3 family protein [Chitinophagaceae bacterium]
MNRRTAIRNAVVIAAGASLLPSCFREDKPAIALRNISLSGKEEEMLAQLAEIIIPTTDFIGAKDLHAYEFILTMVDDCYSPEQQDKFVAGLKKFNEVSKEKTGDSFANATPQQKKDFLAIVESKKDIPEEVVDFYSIAKRHTIQAFTGSQQFMEGIGKYKIIPGINFRGCVAIAAA